MITRVEEIEHLRDAQEQLFRLSRQYPTGSLAAGMLVDAWIDTTRAIEEYTGHRKALLEQDRNVR